MRRRFYLSPAEWGNEISFSLTGDEAHHCRHVVRAKVGDVFELIDGQGRSVPVRVAEFSGKQVEMSPVGESEYQPQKLPLIHLAFAMPKGKNFDLVIQKTTELGVDRIIPLITERTITRPSGKKGALLKKVEKWQRVAIEATKQCGRRWVPEISAPLAWNDFLTSVEGSVALLGSLEAESRSLREHLLSSRVKKGDSKTDLVLAIGPEGDFTRSEYQSAKAAGFLALALGDHILRAETASIAGMTLLAYEFRPRQFG